MKYTKQEEQEARTEYQLVIDTLMASSEFQNEWKGHWEDRRKQAFGNKPTKIKGDREKFMRYWIEDQKILKDTDWNKLSEDDNEYF